MAFTTAYIVSVDPPQPKPGGMEFLSWTASPSLPAGSFFQVYVDNVLAWYGQKTSATVAVPPGETARIVIGSVDAGEESTSFAADLPAPPKRHVTLSWQGGTSEGADLDHFAIYGSPGPGQAISYAAPLATVAASPGGAAVSLGGYSWTSGTLAAGDYSFAVVPVDATGNEGAAQFAAATVQAPPSAPEPFTDGKGLHYAIHDAGLAPGTNPYVVLTWNASLS